MQAHILTSQNQAIKGIDAIAVSNNNFLLFFDKKLKQTFVYFTQVFVLRGAGIASFMLNILTR
jgi:hypothetical protein